MSSGAWVRTGSEAITAIAAAIGAAAGGVWTYFRYLRQQPDIPRVNATVAATIITRSDVDYLVIEVDLEHLAGGTLKIERDGEFDPQRPIVDVSRLIEGHGLVGAVADDLLTSAEVFGEQTELGSGESARDHKIVRLGGRSPDTLAYEATLRLVAGWGGDAWTWCANAIVQTDGPTTATGSTVVGHA